MLHGVMQLDDGATFGTFSFSPLQLLVVILLLFQSCGAASELIGPRQPIIALVGDDVLLPCLIKPAVNADHETVVWAKPGLEPKYVHFHQDGRLWFEKQNPSYFLRTRLFMDELPRGNVSMKIFSVKISDEGTYTCSLPSMQKEASIQLTVGAVSSPIIEVVSNTSGHVVLQCNSAGWYPEPEVFWLDGEGNLLSAGPPETVRGPDDLYTVSSRVTVEKRHSNSFTCRVTQKKTNQTRETQIQVPGDFFTHCPVYIFSSFGVWYGINVIFFLLIWWKQGCDRIKIKPGMMGEKRDTVEHPCLKEVNSSHRQTQTGDEAEEHTSLYSRVI